MNNAPIVARGRNRFASFVFPLLATFAIYFQLFSPSRENGKRILWLVVYVCLYFFMGMVHKKCDSLAEKRDRKYAAVLAVIFAFLQTLGHVMQNHLGFDSGLECLYDLVSLIGLSVIFYDVLLLIFMWIKSGPSEDVCPKKLSFLNGKNAFRISWAVIFFTWLIFLIVFYPGLLSPDSLDQVSQGLTGTFSNWHPVVHTWFIMFFVRIGLLFHNINFGIFLYSLAQCAILSAIFAYSLSFLADHKVKTIYRFLVLLYYAFFPINALLGITMWKDILFSGITLLLVLLLFEIADHADTFFSSCRNTIILVLTLFLFCIFRNNGFYVFLVFLPFFFWMQHRHWKKVLVICCSCLIMFSLYKGPLFYVVQVEETPASEALSVPIQQIARTVKEHQDTLTQRQVQEIQEILPYDNLSTLYNPQLSDPVKFKFNNENFLKNKSRYISLWFELFRKYPGTYFSSFFSNNYGDWYPGEIYYTNTYRIDDNELGIITSSHPKAAMLLEKLFSHILPSIPVISMLFSIGFTVWILTFLFGVCLYRRHKPHLLPFVLLFALWLSILAAPDVEYRYAYGLILSCPICVGLFLFQTKGSKVYKSEKKGKRLN